MSKTDNELIAEFMPDMEFVTPKNERYKPYWKNKVTLAEFKPEALKYHKSWDWLMPVVHKILRVWVPTTGTWPDEYTSLQTTGLGNSIDHIYAKTVDFIKWYNNQNKS